MCADLDLLEHNPGRGTVKMHDHLSGGWEIFKNIRREAGTTKLESPLANGSKEWWQGSPVHVLCYWELLARTPPVLISWGTTTWSMLATSKHLPSPS